MWTYFFIAFLSLVLTFFSYKISIHLRIKKDGFIELTNLLFWFFIFLLFFLSSIRYGIGTDYLTYQARYYNLEIMNEYEWFFSFFGILSNKFGFSFQTFLILNNIITYIIFGITITKRVYTKYRFYVLSLFVMFNYWGASFNYIRQFPAVIIGILFVHFLALAKEEKNKKKEYYLLSFIALSFALGYHKYSLLCFITVLLAESGLINKKTIKYISALFMILYFINPILEISRLINTYIINTNGTIYDVAWGLRLLNQRSSLVNRVLFWPIIIIITKIIEEDNVLLNQKFNGISLRVTYVYYLVVSLNIGSEMIDRALLFIYIFNIFTFPILLEYIKNKKGKIIHLLLYILFLAIGLFVFQRQIINNVYHIVPYKTVFSH